jgi:hypothetical protein
MKTIEIKSGTRAEILEYLHKKISKTITLKKGHAWSEYPKKEDYFQFADDTVEKQIDEYIQSGSPIVSVHLNCYMAGNYRETFWVSDYSDIRINMELAKIDNLELRTKRIEAIKHVMSMELDVMLQGRIESDNEKEYEYII